MKRALISVSDKQGIDALAKELIDLGYEIISTGGTAKYLKQAGLAVTPVEDITGFPECLDGRVKTLHPKIHGGILARRDLADHMDQVEKLGMALIDILVINLYPFAATIAKPDASFADCIEQIDIGGPAMLRSAAKNHASVTVLVDPLDYPTVLAELKETGQVQAETRRKLAAKVFRLTSSYDQMIADYLLGQEGEDLTLRYRKMADLRYGENPQQKASVYQQVDLPADSLPAAVQLHGKALSYNNYADTDAALMMVKEFVEMPTVVAVKHANPCGIASAATIEEAWAKAYAADSVSIFGGIIAQNRPVSLAEAEEMSKIFLEVILAPDYEPAALELLSKKKNIRLLKLPALNYGTAASGQRILKQIYGGMLSQDLDAGDIATESWQVPTEAKPDEADREDYIFAMRVAKHVKSNAIVLVKDLQTVGIGPGQPNRVTAAGIAVKQAGDLAKGSIMASDAFFPFSDTVELAAAAGVKGIIQPGGSIRDQESIEACDKHGIAMIMTGTRHFRH